MQIKLNELVKVRSYELDAVDQCRIGIDRWWWQVQKDL